MKSNTPSTHDNQKDPPKKKQKTSNQNHLDNPLQIKKEQFLQSIPKNTRQNFFCHQTLTPEQRAELWTKQADYGEELVNNYSWATPDTRAINIIKHFAPIIEIGCGKNAYWANILKQCNVDIIAYDCDVHTGGLIDNENTKDDSTNKKQNTFDISSSITNDVHSKIIVQKGGPQILLKDKIIKSNRTLMLCYPDEDLEQPQDESSTQSMESLPSSLGIQCLENFQGDHIIHIGELFADTLSMEQAPWGRSSSAQFQERLAGEYHCLLRASIPNWLHVRDTISVWKRSQRCSIIFQGNDGSSDDEDEEVDYKHIPDSERLPVDIAAPCVQHLLQNNSNLTQK